MLISLVVLAVYPLIYQLVLMRDSSVQVHSTIFPLIVCLDVLLLVYMWSSKCDNSIGVPQIWSWYVKLQHKIFR